MLTNPEIQDEHNQTYCLTHCIATKNPRCQYVFTRGQHTGNRCDKEVGAIYYPKNRELGSDRYCLMCLKKKAVQNSLQ